MPQPKRGYALGSNPSHHRLMLRNLAESLFVHERIRTTEAKAKALRPYAERLISKAKKGTVHHRRQVLSDIENREVVHKLFDDIGPRFSERNGGYTRILKLGQRSGDGAPMALIELVEGPSVTTVDSAESSRRRRGLRRPRRTSEESAAAAPTEDTTLDEDESAEVESTDEPAASAENTTETEESTEDPADSADEDAEKN
ncbi:MAG: 50S ribosomal protein L17 [Actinobacteria bacterium]|nr:50S ribosomal protein L17 [Actinomycetota bacterium]